MKSFILVLLLSTIALPLFNQVYTHQNIDELLLLSEKDSIAYIERKAALEFHKLINKYRKSNSLDPISWNDLLWVATINHNSWMDLADELSHHERTNNKAFTGNSPGNRVDYASGGKANLSWSGENALYNFSCYGNSNDAIANNIARQAFEQWKASPGHNENMLSPRHATHGVAFKISERKVWGTDLFASEPYNMIKSENDNYLARNKNSETKTKALPVSRSKNVIQKDLIAGIKEDFNLKDRQLKASKRNAKAMCYKLIRAKKPLSMKNKITFSTLEEQDINSFLGLFNKKEQCLSAIIQMNETEFNPEEICGELRELINKSHHLNRKSKLDIAIALKKQKGTVKVCLVSIVTQPSGKIAVF